MERYCLALDLVDDPGLIAEYELHHKNVWPQVLESIRGSGVLNMGIYRTGNRLLMVMETVDGFSFVAKSKKDLLNEKVQAWEQLMWKYQQALPFAQPGEKWKLMERIFDLQE